LPGQIRTAAPYTQQFIRLPANLEVVILLTSGAMAYNRLRYRQYPHDLRGAKVEDALA
jgi:hypothetical protein